jgi:hypothetical protein
MKDVFTKKELVDLEYFIQEMYIKTAGQSGDFATTNGCATYYLYLDGFEQRTCLFKPSYFGRNPKGNWIAVDFVIGKNGYCVLGGVRNIDPSVAKNSSNYTNFYKGYVGTYWRFDVPHDFFDYMNESKKSARKSIKESINIFDTLENAWDKSTMNNNVFEKTVLKLKTDSFKDPFNKYSTIYMFADGSSIDCDSLDPFDCDWCTYVSEDLSFVHEFKK